MTTPPTTVERRLTTVEHRLSDVEEGFGETLYRLQRGMVRANLILARVVDHLGLAGVTEEEIDAVLDES